MWPYIATLFLMGIVYLLDRRYPEKVNQVEEWVLVFILAAITLISFSQVVARYGFSTGWDGALETTRILFAWLILFGMSYGIKHGLHLGIDAFIQILPPIWFRIITIFAALATFVYSAALLDSTWLNFLGAETRGGAIDYWHRMFRIGIGLDDVRYPEWMQNAFGLQERVHRFIAYLILPVGLALLMLRTIQALIAIILGKRKMIIASHEAEELLHEFSAKKSAE